MRKKVLILNLISWSDKVVPFTYSIIEQSLLKPIQFWITLDTPVL